ncbi:MAG: glycosyltransferase family 4 protein, partial [Chloroflexi bacterium]|nr:glycosyltransferase family 4 protein [Chloroflexota bacterium]
GALRKLGAELGIADAVTFHGKVSHTALPTLIQRGSLFALSSRHEAQCMAVLEAAACGLPVVGTAVGVVPELAPEAGAAVSVGDEKKLAEEIINFFKHPERAAQMKQAAQTKIQDRFTLAQAAQRFQTIYASIIG